MKMRSRVGRRCTVEDEPQRNGVGLAAIHGSGTTIEVFFLLGIAAGARGITRPAPSLLQFCEGLL
jgi:hypothetical protein